MPTFPSPLQTKHSKETSWKVRWRYPTDWLTDQTLRDESPNIWGYIWPKTSHAIWMRIKPGADWINSANSQPLFFTPWAYMHIRDTNNSVNLRYDSSRVPSWSASASYNLWSGFRGRVYVMWVFLFSAWVRTLKVYVWWVLRGTTTASQPPTTFIGANARMWRKSSNYYTWYIRDPRIYTFTWSFTDADALKIYNWWDPVWLTKYLNWRPMVWESWNTVLDYSGNSRKGTLIWGAYRTYAPN